MSDKRDQQTKFIRKIQRSGVVFVCPSKDRQLHVNEEACEHCDCIVIEENKE